VNAIAIVQLLPAAKVPLAGQVVEGASAKSPLTLTLNMLSVCACPFFKVTFFVTLVVPTVWLANGTLAGDNLTNVPKPVRSMY
jgi:hypothetical protein